MKRILSGIWWLPENPDERLVGTLTFSPAKSPKIHFVAPSDTKLGSVRFPEVMHGCDQYGQPITLLKLGQNSGHYSFSLQELNYSAGFALLGIELIGKEDLVVGEIELFLQHFYNWLGTTGFQPISHVDQSITMSCSLPPLLEFITDKGNTVKIVFSIATDAAEGKYGGREELLSENASIKFCSESGFDFKRLESIVTALRHLIHFAILEPVFPLVIKCRKARSVGECFSDCPERNIEILWSAIHDTVPSENDPGQWVFQFPDIGADFGVFISKWMQFVETYDESLGCYFTTVHAPLTDSIHHLCLTQALEAYHGIRNNSLHSRTVSFETRIKELLSEHSDSLTGLIDDPSDFARSVTVNRHYYTHHNPEWLTQGVLSGIPLLRLNEKLKILFQMCVLKDIGISPTRFYRLRRQLADHVIMY